MYLILFLSFVATGPLRAEETTVTLIDTKLPKTASLYAPEPFDRTGAPDDLAEIEWMLGAWHPEDLPEAAQWAKMPNAAPALLWLGNHGELNRDRSRALAALRYFKGEAIQASLVENALNPALHALVRRSALLGLQGQQLSREACEGISSAMLKEVETLQRAMDALKASPACSQDD